MFREMFLLLAGSIPIYASVDPLKFRLVCVGALVAAVLLWWLCNAISGLWNRSYSLIWFHHVLCAFAAVWTVVFLIAFASVGEVGRYFDQIVSAWSIKMRGIVAGEAADRPGTSTFSGLQAEFEISHPFLRDVVQCGQSGSPESRASDEAKPANFRVERRIGAETIDQVSAELKNLLTEHVHWAIFRLRALLLLSFLLAQALVFGLTGYAASRDICPCV